MDFVPAAARLVMLTWVLNMAELCDLFLILYLMVVLPEHTYLYIRQTNLGN